MRALLLLFMFAPFIASAQSDDNIMYSSGRIYVVIVVILIILLGLFFYLIRIDRKLKKLEEESKKQH